MLNIPINTQKKYSLPVVMNSDDLAIMHSTLLPSFANFEFPIYDFKPVESSSLGKFTIKGIMKNSFGEIAFSF